MVIMNNFKFLHDHYYFIDILRRNSNEAKKKNYNGKKGT